MMVPLIKTPNRVPITLPTPPVNKVPPITTEAMASSSIPVRKLSIACEQRNTEHNARQSGTKAAEGIDDDFGAADR